ncbi:hypothetical protein JKF63_03876 [Porcisia hertigi]|uniref:Uncharacterized protein n=1 Tax=Porcisia hertigi TaxID=2761500 RepID=A0A836HR38_9TRYP|nr:hypothetical protein JKF63_03876 [Porcisia hertigi]
MSVRQTRRLFVLWGQALGDYVPPHSPSGLVRGHLLRRYPVSGAIAAASPALKTDKEVAAHVGCMEWLPARTPAEVVLNANEYSVFHAVPTVGPEDVQWCTRYLLSTSRTFAARAATTDANVRDENVTGTSFMNGLQGGTNSFHKLPPRGESAASAALAPITATLSALLHVLGEHRCLLAGAEALQTGVPISCILAELMEAQMYLTWSLHSHRAAVSTDGVLFTSCNRIGRNVDEDNVSVSSELDEHMIPLTGGRAVSSSEEGSEGPGGASKLHTFPGSSKMGEEGAREEKVRHQQLPVLHRRFRREVAHLHRCGPRGRIAKDFRERTPTSAEGFEVTADLPIAEHRVPLVIAVTPTARGLSAALKSAAVVWAHFDCAPEDGGSSFRALRRCVYAEDVLWRPAPGSSLVATWWTALLHRHLHSNYRASHTEKSCSLPFNTPAPSRLGERRTISTAAATMRGKRDCCSASVMCDEKGAIRASPFSPCECAFHVVITGGDAEDHFLAPLFAGAEEGITGMSTACGDQGARIDATPLSGGEEGSDLARPRGGGAGCVLAPVRSADRGGPERPVVLLCYGCPAGQVAHLRVICDSYLASHDMSVASAAMGSQSTFDRPSGGDAIPGCEAATTSLSGHRHSSTSMKMSHCAVPAIVELCTEASAVSMIAALPQTQSAATPSACSANGAFSLSYHLEGVSPLVPSPPETQPMLFCVTTAAPPRTLEEVAERVAESGLLEQPLRHAEIGDALPIECAKSSPTASLHLQQAAVASAALYGDASLQMGWCSLCFAPELHAPSLLRMLTQRYFRQPFRSGHSFDRMCRRGPAPSPLHVQAAQEVLRCGTKGVCTHGSSPPGRREGSEGVRPGPSSPQAAYSVAPETLARGRGGEARTPPFDGGVRETRGVRPEVRWKHVCGGFTLPLTAIEGRGSPYFVPCLLLSDLAEVASAILEKGQEGRMSQAKCDAKQWLWPAERAPPHVHADFLRDGPNLRLGVALQGDIRRPAGAASEQPRAQVACAVAAVEKSVLHLKCAHDTEVVGYRGVVSGNYLFVCCYPDAWQDAVRDALMRR